MSYLAVLDNPGDTVRLGRIVNEPKRGIGDATLAACQEIAAGLGCRCSRSCAPPMSSPPSPKRRSR